MADTSVTSPILDQDEYGAIVAELQRAAAAYYAGDGSVVMDDASYDAGVRAVRATEDAHPDWTIEHALFAVGGGTAGADVVHRVAMLSLDNVFADTELSEWYQRLVGLCGDAVPVVVEPKLDGLALSVRYRAGQLTLAATRGDGTSGEDVTGRVARVDGLPRRAGGALAAAEFEVRGEVYLTHDGFAAANAERVASGKAPFANPRNAAAGMLRRLDGDGSHLSFAAYQYLPDDGSEPGHCDALTTLADAGFAVNATSELITDADALVAAVAHWSQARSTLGYDIDGAVVKADRREDRERAGVTGRAPRWAIAYKYPADTRLTELLDIVVDVGRTGRVTPVAVLAPVAVGGVVIERATLHNAAEVARRDVRIGDRVWVRRAGEVIPEVVGPQLADRPDSAEAWEMPTVCPRCATELDTSQAVWRCVNRTCGTREQIEYFASRGAMDIDGLGPAIVDQLVSAELVTDVADLYALGVEQLIGLDRMADTSAAKLVAQIDASRAQPLSRVLAGLGVRGTGRRLSARIARHFKTLAALRAASVDELAGVEGVGPIKAESIVAELAELAELCDRLVAAGVRTDEPVDEPVGDQPWDGKRVCVTGSVPGLTRDGAREAVEALGATFVSSVTSRCDLLVAGEKAGSKLAKAQSLGVEVMDGAAFASFLQEQSA